MMLRTWGIISAAAGAFGLLCSSVRASTVTLYIEASQVSHTWVVFASDSIGDNAGLANYSISVTGTGGLSVTGGGQDTRPDSGKSIFYSQYTAGNFKVPSGAGFRNGNVVTTGFVNLPQDGTLGGGALQGIANSQNVAYGNTNDPTSDSLVYQGVGQVDSTNTNPATGGYNDAANLDASSDTLQHGSPAWGSTAATGNSPAYATLIPFAQGTGPLVGNQVVTSAVDIASGTFTGQMGTLTVTVGSSQVGSHIITLNGSPQNPWTGPANITDATVLPVNGASVTLVPEPASLGFIGFAGVALLSRRRKSHVLGV